MPSLICTSPFSFGLQILEQHADDETHRYFTEDSRSFPPPVNTYVIGPCTGGFAAAALSCSQTLPDLVSNGVEAILAAFRTAFRSFSVGQSLSSRTTQRNKSWSAALSPQGDLDIQQLLIEYKSSRVRNLKKASRPTFN